MKRHYNLASQGSGTSPTLLAGINRPVARFAKRMTLAMASLFIFSSAQVFAQTELCIPAPDYVDGDGITNVNIGSINNTTRLETPNYGDYTSQVVNLGQGVSYPISVTIATGSGYNVKVWVDWNNNNIFETGEQALTEITESTITATVTGNIAVPATATLGNHHLRIGITPDYAAPVLPCYTGFNAAAYEDYTINVTTTPTCFLPRNLAVVNAGPGTINLSWAAPANGTTATGYEYAITTTATPPASGTAVTATSVTGITVPLDVTGYIYVRSNCGNNNYSEWVAASFYNGVCVPTPALVNGEGITNFTFGTINNETLTEDGNYGNFTNLAASVGQGVTKTFSVTLSTGTSYRVGIWVDWNNDLDFDDEGEHVYAGTSANRAVDVLSGTITVPANASLGAHRLRLGGGLTFGQELVPCYTDFLGTFEDYTINVTTPPSCFTPLNPTGVSVAAGVANISWTAPSLGTAPAGYEYAVTITATPPATGTAVTATNANNVTVTANAVNYIHVRTNCGGNDYSEWMTATYYNGYCTPEPGYVDGDGITNFTIGTINNTGTPSSVRYENYTDQVAAIGQGVSKQFSISFNTANNAYTTKIWVDWNNDLDFDDAGEEVYTGTSARTERALLNGYITVPLTAALGNHRLRIGALPADRQGPVPCSNNNYGDFEDYTLNVIAPPSCYAPANFAAVSQASGLATVSWTAPALGTVPAGYEYAVTATSEAPATGIVTTATTLNNLAITPNATNYLHVRTSCGGSDFSEWLTISLYNGYCIPAPQTVDNDGITNVTIGSINNTTADQEVYSDFSAQVVNIGQGVTQQFSVSLFTNTPYNVKMWADLNDNLIFEDSELIYNGISPEGVTSVIRSTFTIPLTAPLGNHRLRIAGTPGSTEATPCDIIYYGAYEDYTINVTVPPTCYTPLSPAGNVIGSGNVNLSWTAPLLGHTPAGYEYAVTTSTTSPSAGTPITATSVTGYALAADDTYYYLHVRTNCGDNDFSEWVISERFKFTRGDICSDAINLGTRTSPLVTSTEGAADDYEPTCGSGSGPDIYYSIEVPNGYTLTIGVTDAGYDYAGAAFYGSCANQVSLSCTSVGSENPNTVWENISGSSKTVYWVQDGFNGTSGAFTLAWSLAPPAACDRPRELDTFVTSLTTTNVSWMVPNTGAPAGYEYAVTTSETPPESGTYTTETSATGVAVSPNVDSFLHVRSVCGEDGTSIWVTFPFFSGYCLPTNTNSTEYYISSISTRGAETNLSNTSTGFSAYSDFTATQSLSTYAGGSFVITATTPNPSDTYLYNVWIDWNSNYDFTDNGERVINSGYLTSPATLASITVPLGTPVGSYRMRIRNAHLGVLNSPCGDQGYGETEDYTINIVATPSCFPPSNPVITVADAGYANLGWSPPQLGGTPSGYEYVFSPTATAPTGSGTFTDTFFVGDAEYDPAQSVYLFVRSVCGGGEFSNWVGNQILGTDNPQLNANNVIVYKDGNAINITSGTTLMTGIAVYDTRGRMLYSQANINSTQTTVTDMPIQQQVIIVEVTTAKGKVTKRIVF
ncbi:hypothetical protein Q765_20655 [Flavobacterium rivuli WB 3.3-2 = DSM 21788]|uniref:GEVED domain-containing protein n=1 Tax=Flavobacterium rivuli WB 3.3-2 = DSM 21788 TaxID=1121895 RepID=A0A0A2LZ51_9FLAO|nr:GEVED domain-containing protein [Flavobacterium rivuli]KGO84611.1 hypothetical protein Q765_20655 [Flavobacterium rivuli WB 3.3-2 = DSM 21788]